MIDPMAVTQDLDGYARELDRISKEMDAVADQLRPVDDEYEAFMGAYEEGLWNRHVEDGEKFPPEALRTRMGRRAMSPELLGRYTRLVADRKRMEKRVSSLKAIVDAKRSVLSALRTEMEATR